jgi:hypothetical protein
MYPEIRAFALLADNKIYIEFASGESGTFDMSPYMKSSFFSALHNQECFRRAHLEFGVITWPNGQDMSPATIRLEMIPCKRPQGIELKTTDVHALA